MGTQAVYHKEKSNNFRENKTIYSYVLNGVIINKPNISMGH